jgi:hypothetical protein
MKYVMLEKINASEVLRSKEQNILNTFNYIKCKNPKKYVSWTATETAEASGMRRYVLLFFPVRINLPLQADKFTEAYFKMQLCFGHSINL